MAKQDWLNSGLELVATRGAISLTIDALAEMSGLTKGSFYHHFAGMSDFERQLVERWAQEQHSAIPKLPKDPDRRLEVLEAFVDLTYDQRGDTESAMQAWASMDEMVRKEAAKVDAARRRFYRSVFDPLISDHSQLGMMIEMLVAMLAGSATSSMRQKNVRARQLFAEFMCLYGLDRKSAQELQTRLPI